jgi:RimJ/RimL family protein N-acetyltransferase
LPFPIPKGRIIALNSPMSSHPIRKATAANIAPVTFRSVQDYPDPDALIPDAFGWILAAGQPYFDWLCGSREAAERTVAMWMKQPSSEVFLQRMTFLQCGSQLAGGIIGLGGVELKRARISDVNSYWKTLDVNSRGSLIGRLSQSLHAFAPVAEDEYYISKVGLARSFQGRGLAKVLVQQCLDQGTALGYSKFRADIQTENKPSLRCSRLMGFEIFYTGQSLDGALRYHALRYARKTK